MKKSDLKTGHIIEVRDGRTALIVKDNVYGEDAVIFSETNWTGLDNYGENLYWHFVHRDEYEALDIMKVYKPNLPTGFLSRKNKDMRYSMFFYSPFGASVDEYAEPTLIWKRDESVETVKIGDYEYDKKEFEEATKHLKPVNK